MTENEAILSGLNATLLNFLESLKVEEQNLNETPKNLWIYKRCLIKVCVVLLGLFHCCELFLLLELQNTLQFHREYPRAS